MRFAAPGTGLACVIARPELHPVFFAAMAAWRTSGTPGARVLFDLRIYGHWLGEPDMVCAVDVDEGLVSCRQRAPSSD